MMDIKRSTVSPLAVRLFLLVANPAHAECAEDRKAVLVTGASSGTGRNIAESLVAHCYFVHAGARKQGDLDALDALDNVQSIRLDVTVQDDIDRAVQPIRSEGRAGRPPVFVLDYARAISEIGMANKIATMIFSISSFMASDRGVASLTIAPPLRVLVPSPGQATVKGTVHQSPEKAPVLHVPLWRRQPFTQVGDFQN